MSRNKYKIVEPPDGEVTSRKGRVSRNLMLNGYDPKGVGHVPQGACE